MPILSNARWERFAQTLASGKTATDAYAEAGYQPNRQNAARLTTNDDIKARVAELQERSAIRAEITVAKLTEMYLEDRKLARDNAQAAAAVGAVTALGKLHGLIVDRSANETTVRYVARAPHVAKSVDEWMKTVKPNGKDPEPAKNLQ